jgi:hypothetical protein
MHTEKTGVRNMRRKFRNLRVLLDSPDQKWAYLFEEAHVRELVKAVGLSVVAVGDVAADCVR